MVNDFSLEEMMPTLIETLKNGGEVTFTVTGSSMLPMLRHKVDTVTLIAPCGRLKKRDIPFYKNGEKYILHRIIKVNEKDYTIRGDNCYFIEKGISDDDIIGVVKEFTHKNKKHSVNDLGYRLYAFWRSNCVSYFVRKNIYLKVRSFLGRTKRKIFK